MQPVNEDKLHAFVGKMLNDLGAGMSVPLARIGGELGLWKGLHEGGPQTSRQLADRLGLHERYVREWLSAIAAGGYIEVEPDTGTFSISPEQAMVFVIEDSPVFMMGAFDTIASCLEAQDKVTKAFRDGSGVGWGDHAACLFCATGAFFRPTYVNSLVQEWLPALEGVAEKLEAGARVADVGCGQGFSTALMARAFPNSQFTGFDFHEASIESAREHAARHGLGNVDFAVATAKELPEGAFDLVCYFDCLHDMGDPRGAAAATAKALRPGGSWMVVEPMSHDTLAENMNPVSRLYYGASTMICVPCSLDQEVAEGMGAQAGPALTMDVIRSGGFTQVRSALEAPFNRVYEARL